MLFVQKTDSGITVYNMSDSPVVIRISWDGKDPHGIGAGEDSYLDNNVEPYDGITVPFKEHESVQVWAWDPSIKLVDSCNLQLILNSN